MSCWSAGNGMAPGRGFLPTISVGRKWREQILVLGFGTQPIGFWIRVRQPGSKLEGKRKKINCLSVFDLEEQCSTTQKRDISTKNISEKIKSLIQAIQFRKIHNL